MLNKHAQGGHRHVLRKLILSLLLLIAVIGIFSQRDEFRGNVYYLNGKQITFVSEDEAPDVRKSIQEDPDAYDDYQRIGAEAAPETFMDMKGNVTVIQKFTAQVSRASRASIYFANPLPASATGTIHVDLLDSEGKVLANSKLESDSLANASPTIFSFTGDTERLNSNEIVSTILTNATNVNGISLKVGENYQLRITSENADSEGDLGLYLMDDQTDDGYSITVDGKEIPGGHVFGSIVYRQFRGNVFSSFLALMALTLLFMWIPWDGISEWWNGKHRIKTDLSGILLWIMFLATPLVNFLMLTKIADQYMTEVIELAASVRGVLNLMIIGFILWILFVLTNRKGWAVFLTDVICFIFGMVNYALLQFRDSPLMAADVVNVKTAMQVTKSYQLEIHKPALWAIMITVVWSCAALSLTEKKKAGWKKRLIYLAAAVIWFAGCHYTLFTSSVLEDNKIRVSSFKPKLNYKKNGYMLSFMVSAGMLRVDKPDKYSAERVEEIAKEYTSDTAEQTEGMPNIIAVMNESFSDLRINGDFETNQDYLPFYDSLKENTIKGYAHSSIYGGSTANSEFEFLTGFTMEFLPFHSVPYTTSVKDEVPNLTYDLKKLGYTGNIAFHPGMRDSYNRENVYPLLGFDRHISYEDMTDPVKIRDYVSDERDYEEIFSEYEAHKASDEADKPFYMFNVTIQNHGSYMLENGAVDAGISIMEDSLQLEQTTVYLNLIKKSDEALEKLVTYFSEVDEPTVIVLFGDHQPRIESDFYKELRVLNGKQYKGLEREDRKYEVPFMIWANYDIEEQEGVDLSINYLSSYLRQAIGLPMSGYNKYLMNLYETLPVITDICIKDKDGNYFDPDEKNQYSDLLSEYQTLQYNGFIDTQKRVEDFFNLEDTES